MKFYKKIFFLSIIVSIFIVGSYSVGFENVENSSPTEFTVTFSEQKITPRISTLTEKNYSVKHTTIEVFPIEDSFQTNPSLGGYSVLPFYQAFAVSPGQNTISVTQFSVVDSGIRTFDSQGNFFTQSGGNKIGRGDIVSEIQTLWEIPNQNSIFGDSLDVDSSENVFFGIFDLQGNHQVAKLDHDTDTFTEWTIPGGMRPVILTIDPFDNVYWFSDDADFLGRLDPSTNTITSWCCASTNNVLDMFSDSVGNVYLVSTGTRDIIQFDPSSNTITIWPTLSDNNVPLRGTVDSNGIIFFTERVPFNTFAVARLDPNAQTIKEWLIPELGRGFCDCEIAVDSAGSIFFGDSLSRLVPSTNTVTSWGSPDVNSFLEVDSSDTIFWSRGSEGGTIT